MTDHDVRHEKWMEANTVDPKSPQAASDHDRAQAILDKILAENYPGEVRTYDRLTKHIAAALAAKEAETIEHINKEVCDECRIKVLHLLQKTSS